ncbi:MAG TPA: response regulator [Methylomirabilota bacterium]|nr:response regulator [Methylomirabilota bacterium]
MPASSAKRYGKPHRRALILIVDDIGDVRELYAQYFNALGYRVVTAHDGATGFSAALLHRPDVIVMDLAMPRVDGVTAIKNLKAEPRTRKMPVILLTGYAHRAIEQGGLEAGAAVFLTKPCLPEDLEQHVRSLLGQPPLHDAA